MDKITILNANNENMQVEVVRYFREGDNRYFIFSLHEIDEQGRMNIYVTKVVEQNGVLIGSNIIDDVEWTNLKTTIQRIIKENRSNGNAVVNDISLTELSNIKVLDRRALKLLANSVDVLNLGYKKVENQVQESISEVNIIDNNQSVSQNQSQPTQSNDQQMKAQQQTNGLDIFNVQANQNQPVAETNSNQQQNNQISDNYKELYFQEKENNQKLLEENNKLINELNSCKMIISDIKNILSR